MRLLPWRKGSHACQALRHQARMPFLHMQPDLGLVEDGGLRTVDRLAGDLFAAMSAIEPFIFSFRHSAVS